jgi:hypothetical protein
MIIRYDLEKYASIAHIPSIAAFAPSTNTVLPFRNAKRLNFTHLEGKSQRDGAFENYQSEDRKSYLSRRDAVFRHTADSAQALHRHQRHNREKVFDV